MVTLIPAGVSKNQLNLVGGESRIQKSTVYTNDKKPESEIKKTLPSTTATKRIKYLGINLPKFYS